MNECLQRLECDGRYREHEQVGLELAHTAPELLQYLCECSGAYVSDCKSGQHRCSDDSDLPRGNTYIATGELFSCLCPNELREF